MVPALGAHVSLGRAGELRKKADIDSKSGLTHIQAFEGRASTVRPRIEHQPIPYGNLDPDAIKVVRRLVRFNHKAYLVGGCVRDLLLGCRPKDFDVATSARPPQLRKIFRNCRIIGKRFRLAHMHFRDGKIIEVATFRREPSNQPGETHLITRDNVFGAPHEDARRRDFTINGLFYEVGPGRIIDYVSGLEDIESRVVRTIGDPDIRIQEDPLRILRAIKFTARQDLGMDPRLYRSAIRHRGLIVRAAAPRLFEELLRLLRGGAAQRSIYLAWEMGVLGEFLPELAHWLSSGCEQMHQTYSLLHAADQMIRAGRLPGDAVLIALLFFHRLDDAMRGRSDPSAAIGESLHPIAQRFIIPRRLRDQVRQIVSAQRRIMNPAKVAKSALPRRESYPDAIDLAELTLRARGWDQWEIDQWRRQLPAAAAPPTKPRGGWRRRGRRPGRRRRRR